MRDPLYPVSYVRPHHRSLYLLWRRTIVNRTVTNVVTMISIVIHFLDAVYKTQQNRIREKKTIKLVEMNENKSKIYGDWRSK